MTLGFGSKSLGDKALINLAFHPAGANMEAYPIWSRLLITYY
jgi:hypothetical protein